MRIDNKEKVLKWFNDFADFVEKTRPNIYQDAIDYADDCEKGF
tara:strand:+ start:248 stop:376 length:129 start_codon:yes stop_codon:yes gene_type:complete